MEDIIISLIAAAAKDLRARDRFCERSGGIRTWIAATRFEEAYDQSRSRGPGYTNHQSRSFSAW